MTTRKLIVLNAVYKRRMQVPSNALKPAFTVSGSGATVNIYHFIKETAGQADPANKTTMVLDDGSPYSVGAYPLEYSADNILFETAAGTPVVKTINIVE